MMRPAQHEPLMEGRAMGEVKHTPGSGPVGVANPLRDLVVRAQQLVPDYHLNWHADADAALVAPSDLTSEVETTHCEVDHCRAEGDCYAQAVGMPEYCQKTDRNARLRAALTVAASRMEVASADWGIAAATVSDRLTHADDMGKWASEARAALKAEASTNA